MSENEQKQEPPDLRQIIAGWLKEHGYDGLWDGFECGCTCDDLMPCCQPVTGEVYPLECTAGYLQPPHYADGEFVTDEIGPEKEVAA